MKSAITVLIIGLLVIAASAQVVTITTQEQAAPKPEPQACIAVRPIGSHAFRNIMLAGLAGAWISKQQFQSVKVINYPSAIGHKYHGNELQVLQNGGVKIFLLDKHPSEQDIDQACK